MRRKLTFLLLLIFLGGCATFSEVGSGYWHNKRLKEIESAYQNKEITEKEYLSLKNETDKIRNEYEKENYKRYQYNHSAHYGYYPYRYGRRYAYHYGRHHYGRRHYGHYYGYYH